MMSASSTASGSGQEEVKSPAADAEPEAQIGVPMDMGTDESAWPSALAANATRINYREVDSSSNHYKRRT